MTRRDYELSIPMPETTETLGTALPKEMARVRDKVMTFDLRPLLRNRRSVHEPETD